MGGGIVSKSNRILIDFDRVVHSYSAGWKDGTIYDFPVSGAIEALGELQDNGYEVVIFTTLSSRGEERNKEIKDWLAKFGIYNIEVTNTKIHCRAIIDDRGIRFTNWSDMLRYFI